MGTFFIISWARVFPYFQKNKKQEFLNIYVLTLRSHILETDKKIALVQKYANEKNSQFSSNFDKMICPWVGILDKISVKSE